MSEIVLSNTNYDYSNGSMMVNINPGLVQKSTSSSNHGSPLVDNTLHHQQQQQQQYSTYPAYAFQSMQTMGYAPVANYQMSRLGYFNERQSNSPESISSSSPPTPSPPPPTATTLNSAIAFNTNAAVVTSASTESNNELITPLIASSSPPPSTSTTVNTTPNNGRFNNPTTARVKDMITRANSVPMEFYHTEFLEYSKETYEKKMESKRNKRKRTSNAKDEDEQMNNTMNQFTTITSSPNKKQKITEEKDDSEEDDEEYSDDKVLDDNVSSAEIRRQIHIQSEQKRRAQIKDGFDELRKHLPGCNNKKMSKAALLTRTVQQLQHLKGMQNELLSEVERLLQENEALKKFQHGVLQRQAMEKMYTF
ncbi:unnamed protein product [Mucor hiemalis]